MGQRMYIYVSDKGTYGLYGISFFRSVALLYHFQKKTYRTEAVVAGNHGRVLVLHPAVVKVSTSMCQDHDKRQHALPCTFTKFLWLVPVFRNENLSFLYITCVFNRIFIFFHQILIAGFSHYCDSDFLHIFPDNCFVLFLEGKVMIYSLLR